MTLTSTTQYQEGALDQPLYKAFLQRYFALVATQEVSCIYSGARFRARDFRHR
jgi:hypothetical protein